jgi:osmotically-inducible protein OsmY
MNMKRKRFNWMMAACVVPLIYGLGGVACAADAQTVGSPAATRSTGRGASSSPDGDPQKTELARRVVEALHAQPYLDDRHIDVSVHGGVVVLSGLVYSDWDLEDALRIARRAAGARTVIDSLSIEVQGRR